MTIRSTAFAANHPIPSLYTCTGEDLSPPLEFSGVPSVTRSLALIVDDPDAPQGTWVHWVLYNIPPDTRGLAEGAAQSMLPPGTRSARNSWMRAGYGGPCPPVGLHRYFHKLFALDTALPDLGPDAGKVEVENAMRGHVLAKAELVGTYRRAGHATASG